MSCLVQIHIWMEYQNAIAILIYFQENSNNFLFIVPNGHAIYTNRQKENIFNLYLLIRRYS